jgi:alpha/beta superfamily hydrolase
VAVETLMFTSADGLRLEGRLGLPDDAPLRGGAVICHPHPQYGGSMSSKLVPAMQRALVAAGWATLRFNFRGVGRSEGSFGGGTDEVSDVLGALARVREVVAEPAAVVGWSFGALVGLNAVARDAAVGCYVGVAPPVRRAMTGKLALPQIAELDGWKARSLIACGTEDPFCRPVDAEEVARRLPPPSDVRVVPGADHFFEGLADELCSIVVQFVDGT